MLTIIRGDDTTINITCLDDNGAAIDITGYTIFFTVKSNINDADASAVISKQTSSHTSPTQGRSTITLAHADTDIAEGDYIYDFQLVSGSGAVTSTERNILTVRKDVTIRTS